MVKNGAVGYAAVITGTPRVLQSGDERISRWARSRLTPPARWGRQGLDDDLPVQSALSGEAAKLAPSAAELRSMV
jgi:hypothetical protein